MIPIILIHQDLEERRKETKRLLETHKMALTHPDLLYLDESEKLGIEQARKIKDFLSLKPFQGTSQAVVLISADLLTPDAQNALLKILEEHQEGALLILGVTSEDKLLPTILSRCQIQILPEAKKKPDQKYQAEIAELLKQTAQQRFVFIEKLENREEFLPSLTSYFRSALVHLKGVQPDPPERCASEKIIDFLKDLLQAEEWAKQNVNIRAILEYLMLKMPQEENQDKK